MNGLTDTAHLSHERLLLRVDALLDVARAVGTVPCEQLRDRVEQVRQFLLVSLLPHMDATESAIYPRLEMLLSDQGACGPLRREHDDVRRLVAELDRLCSANRAGEYRRGPALALRRVLYRIHAIVRVHLDEEEMMVDLLAGSVDPDEAAAIATDIERATSIQL